MTLRETINALLDSSPWALAIITLIIAFILWRLEKWVSKKKADPDNIKITDTLPYRLKDNFLTPPEMRFYQALKPVAEGKLLIFPKVGLKDFIFIIKDTKDYMKYFGQISQKHIDFLLCNPETLKPICGIELDDSSHNTQKAKERDALIEKVYKNADFPLVRFRTKQSYTHDDIAAPLAIYLLNNNTPTAEAEVLCPKCNIPLVLRTSSKDGSRFYGCKNYPNCRETIPIK